MVSIGWSPDSGQYIARVILQERGGEESDCKGGIRWVWWARVKVRVGRCRFACIHRPTDLVALVNQNEIPAKIDQTNDIPNKYKRWIHDVDYNADVERE